MSIHFSLSRPRSRGPWFAAAAAVGAAAPLVMWDDLGASMALALSMMGALVAPLLALLVTPWTIVEMLQVDSTRIYFEGTCVDLSEPHRAVVCRARGQALVELRQEPDGERLRISVCADVSPPMGWHVPERDLGAEPWRSAQLETKRGRRAAAALMEALAEHQHENRVHRATRFLPWDPSPVSVSHVVVQSLAPDPPEPAGGFRGAPSPTSGREGFDAVLAEADWYDPHLGATSEWILVREPARTLLFPVGHTQLTRGEGRACLRTRDEDGAPFVHPLSLDDLDVLDALAAFLDRAR